MSQLAKSNGEKVTAFMLFCVCAVFVLGCGAATVGGLSAFFRGPSQQTAVAELEVKIASLDRKIDLVNQKVDSVWRALPADKRPKCMVSQNTTARFYLLDPMTVGGSARAKKLGTASGGLVLVRDAFNLGPLPIGATVDCQGGDDDLSVVATYEIHTALP